jgi:DNA-binding NarL/FixJ family response regulator
MILARLADMEVVGTAADGRAGISLIQGALAAAEPIDVVITDIAMPDLDGTEFTRRIKALAPATRVIACTMHADDVHIGDVLNAGADGYLLKYAVADELADAIRAVARGETVFSPTVARQLATRVMRERRHERLAMLLTFREREILSLLALGATSKDVGRRFGMNPKSVENARARILTKFGVKNMPAAIAVATKEQLLLEELMSESEETYL